MNTILKFFYPTYYTSIDLVHFIVYVSLEIYLIRIQPFVKSIYWSPSCHSINDNKFKQEIKDLLVCKLINAFKKNNIKIYSKNYEWCSFLQHQLSIHIFNELIHYFDIFYQNNFELYEDKEFKINYYSPIYYIMSNPYINIETGGTFDCPKFNNTLDHFRKNFLEMHNNIDPTNSIISLDTKNIDEQHILQKKLIFLLIQIINRIDFENIVKIIEEQTLKEKIKPKSSNIHLQKIIPNNF